ncbi:hypothetical protein PF008_g20528 [Phytophthora fragariae]|uniref:HAT C-terminal dimerisation domain-containing protein n=1 Tax=Phytophthora fragariae TaxID=53985 RepID=A0A6G0QZZ7_9STRA|nr:hypothetical protein PF008_g20528 [Phytophthora fragariae]
MAWWVNKVGRAPGKEHYYPLLAPLAAWVCAIPTSSAASERSWSIHDFIHTKRRNRLNASRVEKLVFIYCNAGSKDAKANTFYKLGDEGEEEDDGEADADGVDQDSEGSSVSSASSGGSNRAIEDFSLSYEGSEEQKHEG